MNTEFRTIVFKGLLSVLWYDLSDHANKFCSIWMMKEYGIADSWYKYVKVDLSGGIKWFVGVRKNGHILLEGDGSPHWELSSYDPCNKEMKKLGIHGILGRFHVDNYEENLILLNQTDVLNGREQEDEGHVNAWLNLGFIISFSCSTSILCFA